MVSGDEGQPFAASAAGHNGAMDKLRHMESFVAAVQRGSLAAAATSQGVAAAMLGRRIDALEAHLGVKLLVRTTRRLALTAEGTAFLEHCQRILADVAQAEAGVSAGGVRASGHLRITAPAGFGRRHVAPLVPRFCAAHPEVTVSLNLSDRLVDLAAEGFDAAVRVGDMPDSSWVSTRLADNRRLCVAAPSYVAERGLPQHPSQLHGHTCLVLSSEASQSRGWAFEVDGKVQHQRPQGRMDCTDGQVLHDWCLRGHGLAWRSSWEVAQDIREGRLVAVLEPFAAPPNGIYAVFAQRKHMPLRVRLWVEMLKASYGQVAYWESTFV